MLAVWLAWAFSISSGNRQKTFWSSEDRSFFRKNDQEIRGFSMEN